MDNYEILLNQNAWLKDYKGVSLTERLKQKLLRGVFEEHVKKADTLADFKKRALVTSFDPETKELLDIGASSLLRNPKTGKIEFNLINENLARYMLAFLAVPAGTSLSGFLTQANLSDSIIAHGSGTTDFCSIAQGNLIQFGGSNAAPSRNDYTIAALPNAPESVELPISSPQIFPDEHITFEGVITSCGGTGIAEEVGTIASGRNSSNVQIGILLTRDLIGSVGYIAGKSLSVTYSWQF